MAKVRHSRSNGLDPTDDNGNASFEKHHESMRQFRLAHHPGGATKATDTTSTTRWSALIPMWRIMPSRFSGN